MKWNVLLKDSEAAKFNPTIFSIMMLSAYLSKNSCRSTTQKNDF